MSIASLSSWIQNTDLATTVRESQLLYPVIMSLHLACIGFFGGLILVTDLRLLGLTMTCTPASAVIARLRALKWVGFIVMITCGVLLATSKMDTYYPNPYFEAKMVLLALVGVHALVFHGSVYGRSAPATGSAAKIAGAMSLLLWTGILSLGRWIAYYEPRK
jgi:hypothetical protein